jgi:hypothetical protein
MGKVYLIGFKRSAEWAIIALKLFEYDHIRRAFKCTWSLLAFAYFRSDDGPTSLIGVTPTSLELCLFILKKRILILFFYFKNLQTVLKILC